MMEFQNTDFNILNASTGDIKKTHKNACRKLEAYNSFLRANIPMPITDWPIEERPRERLLNKGAESLSEAELLAIFLRTGVKGKTAVDLARDLLTEFGGLRNLLRAPQKRFCQSRGLGLAKYAQLQAVLEMSRRDLREKLRKNNSLKNGKQVKNYLTSMLRHEQREIFACLFLDAKLRILHYEAIFSGTIDHAIIYPREVVKCAMKHNASCVILAHNHPSGIAVPSQADKAITKELIQALKLFDIRVIDHMIVGEKVFSFLEAGLL